MKTKDLINKQDVKWVVLSVLMIFLIIWTTRTAIINRKEIRKDYKIAQGKIINYWEFGVDETHYIEYEYVVEGKKYKRKINLSNEILDTFEENNPRSYEKYCFWVIYSPKNPQKSLINLESTCYCDSSFIPFSD